MPSQNDFSKLQLICIISGQDLIKGMLKIVEHLRHYYLESSATSNQVAQALKVMAKSK